jgi:hypothetical protein
MLPSKATIYNLLKPPNAEHLIEDDLEVSISQLKE